MNEYDEAAYKLNLIMRQQRALDAATRVNADLMAELLTKHLRAVAPYRLKSLKKELAKFNMHTKEWT